MAYKPLSENDVSLISLDYFNRYQHKAKPQEKAIALLIGGQSGAGKSGASRYAQRLLREQGGYIRIDADRMREELPNENKSYPSDVTQKDAGRLVLALRQATVLAKKNFIEEGTFRDPEGTRIFVDRLKEHGYQVHFIAVATAKEKSLLGVYTRYENQIQEGASHPRILSDDYHDMAFKGFSKSFRENSDIYDSVKIINREGKLLFDNLKHQTESPHQVLMKHQRLNLDQLKEIQGGWQVIEQSALARGETSSDYLASIAYNKQRIEQEVQSLEKTSKSQSKSNDIEW